MRAFFFITIILTTACSDSSQQLAKKSYPALNYQALKPLFLKYSQDFQTAALEQFKKADYATFYDLNKQNPEQLQQKLQPIIKQLKQQANNAATTFTYDTHFVFSTYDEKTQILAGSTPKLNYGKVSFYSSTALKPYPKHIILLIANSEIAHNLVISPEQWQTIKQDFTAGSSNRLNAQFIIEVKELQNKRFLQAIIKEIKLSSNRGKLLLHLIEPRTTADIIANSILPKGITLNLTPIHSFDYYGIRLLDPISDTLETRQICTKNGTQKGHLSLSCNYTQGQELNIRYAVIGGRITRIQLQTSGKLNPEQRAAIINQATQKLGISATKLIDSTRWEHYGVKISFNRQALEQQTDDDQPRTIFDLQPISWLNYIKE